MARNAHLAKCKHQTTFTCINNGGEQAKEGQLVLRRSRDFSERMHWQWKYCHGEVFGHLFTGWPYPVLGRVRGKVSVFSLIDCIDNGFTFGLPVACQYYRNQMIRMICVWPSFSRFVVFTDGSTADFFMSILIKFYWRFILKPMVIYKTFPPDLITVSPRYYTVCSFLVTCVSSVSVYLHSE
jgi:hypothetical protein